MAWTVLCHDAFLAEFEVLDEAVQNGVLTMSELLALGGRSLGRPHVDTLAGSRYANVKELRFDSDGVVWRVALEFEPSRQAVILVAGDKSGVAQKRFYKTLIAKDDARFTGHMYSLKDD